MKKTKTVHVHVDINLNDDRPFIESSPLHLLPDLVVRVDFDVHVLVDVDVDGSFP